MSRRISFKILTLFFVVCITLAALLFLNALAGRAGLDDRIAQIQKIYVHDEYNIFRPGPGVVAELPMGVYGPFTEQWRESGATYHVEINDDGFRCPPIQKEKTPGVFRIAFLGDSSTFGWDVEYPETFVRLTDKALADQGRKVEVLNAGVPGYSTHQGLQYLESRVITYRPDVLVISFARNDEIDVTFNPGKEARTLSDSELMPRDEGPNAFQKHMLVEKPDLVTRLRSSGLYHFIRGLIVKQTEKDSGGQEGMRPIEIKRRVSLDEYEQNLEAMVELAKAVGCQTVFLNVGSTTEEYPAVMKKVAGRHDAAFVDGYQEFDRRMEEMRTSPRFESFRKRYADWLGAGIFDDPNNSWLVYSTDFAHPNAIGHALIADALVKHLNKIVPAGEPGISSDEPQPK